MTDIARLRFQSIKKPAERGTLILRDDGTLRVEPSPQFRDAMAQLEEDALRRSHAYGTRMGIVLLVLGGAALGMGWLVGRVFGRLGTTLTEPRPLADVEMARGDGGSVHVRLRGAQRRWQRIDMGWNPDEVLQAEADKFVAAFEAMKNQL